MDNRFQTVFRLEPNLYTKASPVIIEAGALQKDTATGKVLAQIKFRNISKKIIIGCKIKIDAYEISGGKLNGVDSFSYLDFSASEGMAFGSKTPVFLKDSSARKVEVKLLEVIFEGGEIWTPQSEEYVSIRPERLTTELSRDLIEQYNIEIGKGACDYVPTRTNGLFICTCGAINAETNDICYDCRRSLYEVSSKCDKAYLEPLLAARLEADRKRRQKEKEEEERKTAELKKKLKIVVPVVAVLIILLIAYTSFIKPALTDKKAYNKAMECLEAGEFEQAQSIFYMLYDYKDSMEMYKESFYRQADDYLANGEEDKAIEIFSGIAEYKDSEDKIKQIEESRLQKAYDDATELMNKEKFKEAIAAFKELGDFKNSKEMASACTSMQNASIYSKALDAMDAKEYDEAISLLGKISGYQDAAELLQKAKDAKSSAGKNTGTTKPKNTATSWSAKKVYFNCTSNGTNSMNTIGMGNPVYCHFVLSGPDAKSTYIHANITFPDGSTTTSITNSKYQNQGSGWFGWTGGVGSTEGTLYISLYDDAGNYLGGGSVYIAEAAATDPSLIAW